MTGVRGVFLNPAGMTGTDAPWPTILKVQRFPADRVLPVAGF